MNEISVFVTKGDNAVIECPNCDKRKSVSVSSFKGNKFSMTVKCSCQHVFKITLDFRQHYRKSTSIDASYQKSALKLDGHYKRTSGNKTTSMANKAKSMTINCTVKDISFGGLSLKIIGQHMIEVGDELVIDFTLDDKKETHLVRQVTVKSVHNNDIGTEFHSTAAHEPALGFYLMP